MTGRRLARFAGALLIALLLRPEGIAAAPFDLHVLAIGSERYATPADPAFSPFADLPGIAEGAGRVAETLRAAGARRVRLLTSGEEAFVSRSDVLDALDGAIAEAKGSEAPFLIVYFAGHGVSEGFAWSHFSVPGTLAYRGDLATFARTDGLERHALAAGEFVDRLEKGGVPYMLILDNCREGREQPVDGIGEMLGAENEEMVGTVQQALRRLNMFEGPNPVLFSTIPGTSVLTAALPDDPFESIGPLGRRILLAARREEAGGSLTLGGLVSALTDARLDPDTRPAVTNARPDETWRTELLRFGRRGSAVLRLRPTGREADPCCTAPAGPALTRLSGSLRIVSAPVEHWLVEGEPSILGSGNSALVGYVPEPGAVTIEASQADSRWTLTLAAVEGRSLSTGLHENAERALVQGAGRPGISFGATARSCNAVAGRYRITRLALDSDRIARLAAQAWLSCDDIPGEVQIAVDVAAVE